MKRMLKKATKIIPKKDPLASALVLTAGTLMKVGKSPDDQFGDLFLEVQRKQVFADGKTFVDLVPNKRAREIRREYELVKKDPDFDLAEFVNRHFYEFNVSHGHEYVPDADTTARQHVRNLWKVLERRNRLTRGSLFALPYKYVVPGGRFSEQFYWDSYFIMLGLAADKEWKTIEGMMKNYAHMIRKFGFIPTGNRTYFVSRSQPPFFSHMVALLAQHKGKSRVYVENLPYMVSEYRFWMKSVRYLNDHPESRAYARVMKMPDGSVLNRYFDNRTTPRPEMVEDDIAAALDSPRLNKDMVFLDLRAAAESGWDFSSRWFALQDQIGTIRTTDMAAVDLNCLLYHLEISIAESYRILKRTTLQKKFLVAAAHRARAIRKYNWNAEERFFCDYNSHLGIVSDSLTLAGVYPLYAKIATQEQAAQVAYRLEREFLKPGGLVTTLVENGQQWDSPNGWAPLQWVAIKGLREYGYHSLANKIRDAWLANVEQVFAEKRKFVEKYDVTKIGGLGGGGEYPLQDGFGWTNGVYAALYDEKEK